MTLSFIVRRSVVLFYIVSTAGEIEMILSSAFAFAPPISFTSNAFFVGALFEAEEELFRVESWTECFSFRYFNKLFRSPFSFSLLFTKFCSCVSVSLSLFFEMNEQRPLSLVCLLLTGQSTHAIFMCDTVFMIACIHYSLPARSFPFFTHSFTQIQ